VNYTSYFFCKISSPCLIINYKRFNIPFEKAVNLPTGGGEYLRISKRYLVGITIARLKLNLYGELNMARILIVEDERSIREALRFELEDDGFEVMDAIDFSEAVNACNAFSYDLIISDLYLQKGNGIELFHLIKQGTKPVPFILITAFPGTDLASKAKSILKDCFFEKPFGTLKLKEKISEILN
jgi:CheY-like chemotaxis protein